MGWLREAISDDCGMADMAYIVIGSLAVSAIFAVIWENLAPPSLLNCMSTLGLLYWSNPV